jgi:hypothetical protein
MTTDIERKKERKKEREREREKERERERKKERKKGRKKERERKTNTTCSIVQKHYSHKKEIEKSFIKMSPCFQTKFFLV